MIKQPIFLLIAVLAMSGACLFTARTAIFISGAERTIGTVKEIRGTNTTCRTKKRRSLTLKRTYPCTVYQVVIEYYSAAGEPYSMERPAGSAREHNQPKDRAGFTVGRKLPVLYNRETPTESRLDQFDELWSVPAVLGLMGLVFFGMSFFQPQKRVR